ncbi:protein serine/threonine phosphatase [candidate division SR1 bacterium RAAC1_SR1_1]|nr:protein serine/threonine phosphatase [candidate division SR1 bacterium RAAC1_SR1_1]
MILERVHLSVGTKIFLNSCKYIVASSLFVLLNYCKNPDFSESKKNDKLQFTPIITDSKLNFSGATCDANDINVIANEYIREGKYNVAIDLLLSTRDSLLKKGMSREDPYMYGIYDNLGNVYSCIKEDSLSIDYHLKGINIARKNGNKRNLLFSLNNLASTYLNSSKQPIHYDKAIPFLMEAVDILQKGSEILGDDYYIKYLIYSSLANSYIGVGKASLAEPYFFEAKKLLKEYPRSSYETICLLTTEADLSIADKDYKQAFLIYEEAITLAKESNNLELQDMILNIMKDLAISIKDYSLAYSYLEQKVDVSNIRFTEKAKKDQLELETKYKTSEYILEAENQRQRTRVTLLLLLLAVGAAITGAGVGYTLKRKNTIITAQRDENARQRDEIIQKQVELETAYEELQATNEEIDAQKQQIQKSHTQITSSINYASRLQNHFLYNNIDVKEQFGDTSIVFYRPKDIVSGDFYFSADLPRKNPEDITSPTKKMLMVADCTGHGVPGSLLTILGQTKVKQFLECAHKPSDIINSLDHFFIQENTKEQSKNSASSEKMHDSIDVECVFYDPSTRELEYSSSSRPIIIFREGKLEKLISTSRGDVGSLNKKANFAYETHQYQLKSGDEVFLFSDGMVDQFVAATDKKLGSKGFYELLKKVISLPVEERELFISQQYEEMIGTDENQTDDILLVGFRVS